MTPTVAGRKIVVGVDASEHAARAADWAAAQAAERGVPLEVVHAFDFDPGSALIGPLTTGGRPDWATRIRVRLLARTERRVRAAHRGLDVTCLLAYQSAADALVSASRNAQLVVVGTRGRGGFAGLALGSVGLRLVAHARCPVVLVRAAGDEDVRVGQIVLGVGPGVSEQAVLFAFEEAARAGTGLCAVRAWAPHPAAAQEDLGDTGPLARDATADVVATLQRAREKFPEVPVTLSVKRGHPAAVLADASRQARLTVVGAHRRCGPLSLSVGPVIHALLSQTRSPVAVIPTD